MWDECWGIRTREPPPQLNVLPPERQLSGEPSDEAQLAYWAQLKSRFLSHAGWLVGGTTLQGLVAFGANLILVRLLLPEEFGRFAIVQANIALAGTFINFKVDDVVLRLRDEEIDRDQMGVFGAALVAETLGILALAGAVLSIIDLLSLEAILLLLGSVIGSWTAVESRLYERGFEYRNLSVIETVSHLGGHLFTVAGALAGWGAIVLYLRTLINQVAKLTGLGAVGALRAIPVKRAMNRSDWKDLLRQVRGFWADGVLAQGFERAVILVVAGMTGERTTGFFFQARRLAVVPHQLLQPVTFRMAFNYFSRETSPTQIQLLRERGLGLACLGLSIGAVIAYVTADPIIPWLFGEGWDSVVPLFRGMAGVLVGMTLFTMLQAYHMALGRMGRFVALGRSGQYAMFLVAALMGVLGLAPAANLLALGLSASFLVPTGLLLATPSEQGPVRV